MTALESVLISAIVERGIVRSLFRLTNELRLDYKYAWRCVQRLEARGLITVERHGPGAALVLSVANGDSGEPTPARPTAQGALQPAPYITSEFSD